MGGKINKKLSILANMKEVKIKLEDYLTENFKGCELIEDNSIQAEDESVEVYGKWSVVILVKKIDDKVFYRPMLKNLIHD